MFGGDYPKAYAFSGHTGREGDYVMPGIRVDRLLASTAVALLLAASASGALADPSSTSGDKPVSAAPTAVAPAGPAAPAATETKPESTQGAAPAPAAPKADASGNATPSPAAAAPPAAQSNP